MSTYAPIDVDAVFLGTSDTLIGQPTGGKSWAVARICLCNTDSVDHTVDIGTTSAGSLDAQHTEHKTLTIQAQSTFDWGPSFLPSGRNVFGKASSAGVISARIHGIEKTP